MKKRHFIIISLILLCLFTVSKSAQADVMAFSISYSTSSYYPGYYGVFRRYYGYNPFYPRVYFPVPTPWQKFRDYLRLKGEVEHKLTQYYAMQRQENLTKQAQERLDQPVPQEFYDKLKKEEQERVKEIEIDVVPDLEETLEDEESVEDRDSIEKTDSTEKSLTQDHGAVVVNLY